MKKHLDQKLKINLNQIINKRTFVNLYKDIVLVTRLKHFLYDIVYLQKHKIRDSNACLSVRSRAWHKASFLLAKGTKDTLN